MKVVIECYHGQFRCLYYIYMGFDSCVDDDDDDDDDNHDPVYNNNNDDVDDEFIIRRFRQV